MDIRRLIPYLAGLIVLAFALGSLPRGASGSSLLFQSTWLLYLIYAGPIATIAVFGALIVLIGLNWRDLGAGLGFGVARRRGAPKRRSRYATLVALVFWAIAIGVLVVTPGSILNPSHTNTTIVTDIKGDSTAPPNPLTGGVAPAISSLLRTGWFGYAMLGLLIVGGLVLFQTVRVAIKETSDMRNEGIEAKQAAGLVAINEAIKIVNSRATDPRSRIISCYQRMLTTVSTLGVTVHSDQTARELETAIRTSFGLKGSATSDLTQIFEEARYSLHEIDETDAADAREYLESIADELRVQLND